jgi:hypothetical protein
MRSPVNSSVADLGGGSVDVVVVVVVVEVVVVVVVVEVVVVVVVVEVMVVEVVGGAVDGPVVGDTVAPGCDDVPGEVGDGTVVGSACSSPPPHPIRTPAHKTTAVTTPRTPGP